MTYSFSIIHATAYSFIGFQTAYLATKFPSIYWNTACLVVNSASLEGGEGSKSTDYTKTAKALSDSISRGIKVSLVDINKSDYSFKPDVENNQILFGMKALSRVNGETIEKIKEGRPYTGIGDFMSRCPLNKLIMVTLIKSGAFDTLDSWWASSINEEPRIGIMAYYISQISEPKKKLNLTNFNTLINKELIPEGLSLQKTVFLFNKYLKSFKRGNYFVFTDSAYNFYTKYYSQDNLEVIDGVPCINQKTWDKIYQSEMDIVREWIKNNQEETLKSLNEILFRECWEKYCKGNISSWEMESLCFYYHEHELNYVDDYKYGLADYQELDPEPVVSYTFNRNNREIPIFELYKIIGTVLSKNDTKSTVSILTTTGVVNVKFTKEYYANYNRQLSKVNEDGTKSVVDKSWFTRGVKVMITGYRREDFFVAKTYTRTPTHQLYKITEVLPNGDMVLVHDRVSTGEDDGEFIE